jgi:hypothetical protein
MKRVLVLFLAGGVLLSACGIDGEPLTPPAKSSRSWEVQPE